MRPESHEDIAARLARLTDQTKVPTPSRQRRGRGRPTRLHIRRTYIRTETYLPPGMVAGLERLATDMAQHSGRSVGRSNIVRLALSEYLRHHLPAAEL